MQAKPVFVLTRIYVHDNIYQAFAEKFVQEVQKFKVGNGLEDGVQIGPIN